MRTYNITQTYVDEDEPWSVILAVEVFAIHLTTNGPKVYSLGQLLFCGDMILLIKYTADW